MLPSRIFVTILPLLLELSSSLSNEMFSTTILLTMAYLEHIRVSQHAFEKMMEHRRTMYFRYEQQTRELGEVSYLSHLGRRGKAARRRLWRKKRSRDWWVNVVPSYTDRDFVEDFRLNKDTFKYVVQELKPFIEKKKTNNGVTFCAEWRVALTLYRLASGMSFKRTGNQFGCAKSTACTVYHKVCKAIETLLMPKFIKFPTGEDLLKNIEKFKMKNGFPQAVAAIDGTHIPIIAPEEEPNDYYNRHDVHSIILQGVVDADGMFVDTFCGMPGSVNDARVFSLSQLCKTLKENRLFNPCPVELINNVEVPPIILGDGAYPMLPNLMRPFAGRNSLPRDKNRFNKKLSGCRIVVEHAFGRLKGRWRILLKRNEHQLHNLRHVVQTCCTLHNICQTNGVPYSNRWDEKSDPKKKKDKVLDRTDEPPRAEQIRNALVDHLMTL